jgi:hypothetical protein
VRQEFSGFSARICFVQNNCRARAGFPALRHISFDAPNVEIAVQRGDHQNHINIRNDYLLGDLFPGNFTNESAAPRENVLNYQIRLPGASFRGNPIADSRPIPASLGVFPQFPGRLPPTFFKISGQPPQTSMLRHNTRRHRAIRGDFAP